MRSHARFKVRSELLLNGTDQNKTGLEITDRIGHWKKLFEATIFDLWFWFRSLTLNNKDFTLFHMISDLLATCCVVSLVNVLLGFEFTVCISDFVCSCVNCCCCFCCCCVCPVFDIHLHLREKSCHFLEFPDIKIRKLPRATRLTRAGRADPSAKELHDGGVTPLWRMLETMRIRYDSSFYGRREGDLLMT